MEKWFILENDTVRGPYSTLEIQNQSRDGDFKVWGKPLESWCSQEKWKKKYSDIIEFKKVSTIVWHYAKNSEQFGPFSKEQLLEKLKDYDNHEDTLIWTKGMSEWQSLYEFYDLIKELGLNARKTPRKAISGEVILNGNNNEIKCEINSISENGLGLRSNDLFTGQQVQGTLLSSSLNSEIRFYATISYATEQGHVGLKFNNLHTEAKSTILQFIKDGQKRAEAA